MKLNKSINRNIPDSFFGVIGGRVPTLDDNGMVELGDGREDWEVFLDELVVLKNDELPPNNKLLVGLIAESIFIENKNKMRNGGFYKTHILDKQLPSYN